MPTGPRTRESGIASAGFARVMLHRHDGPGNGAASSILVHKSTGQPSTRGRRGTTFAGACKAMYCCLHSYNIIVKLSADLCAKINIISSTVCVCKSVRSFTTFSQIMVRIRKRILLYYCCTRYTIKESKKVCFLFLRTTSSLMKTENRRDRQNSTNKRNGTRSRFH